MGDLENLSPIELLQTHGAVIDELQRRGIVRTRNNPIGDYTEWLVCRQMQLEIQGNSQSAFDAVDASGTRYQIKGRRSDSKRVQFSAIRNLDQQGFDYVIAVAYNSNYSIRFAVKMPHTAVKRFARYRKHVNAHILILTEDQIEEEAIQDVSEILST